MQVQSESGESSKRVISLEKALERHRQDLDREAEYRQAMEGKWKDLAQDYDSKASLFMKELV